MKRSKKSRKKKKKANRRFYWGILALSFVLSMTGSYFYFEKMFAFKSSFIEDIGSQDARGKQENTLSGASRLYESSQQDSIGREVLRKDTLLVDAENIIREYFLAYKVRLLDLYMDKRGVIYVDIGDELKRNFKGNAIEELSIIAGLYEEIKSTIPDFTTLKILIEGREAESFGGHIDISRPIGEEIVESI